MNSKSFQNSISLALAVFWLTLVTMLCFVSCFFWQATSIKIQPEYANTPPSIQHWLGTDHLGRDLFQMLVVGGRISLALSFVSASMSSFIGLFIGAVVAVSSKKIEQLLMKVIDSFILIPSFLLLILFQSIFKNIGFLGLALSIALVSWMPLAKIVHVEVKKIHQKPFIIQAVYFGSSFSRLIFKYYLPNIFNTIFFIIVMNLRSAIMLESTLSFLGLGLPLQTITWGNILSSCQQSFIYGNWWTLLFSGLCLVFTMLSLTSVAQHFATKQNPL